MARKYSSYEKRLIMALALLVMVLTGIITLLLSENVNMTLALMLVSLPVYFVVVGIGNHTYIQKN